VAGSFWKARRKRNEKERGERRGGGKGPIRHGENFISCEGGRARNVGYVGGTKGTLG